ncbi:ABC transporter permease [Candidatus Bipolaricaulota bacterium]|nr:ABC transporter permease [Candidatus Bipolaricaulota bacterium]MBS3792164.1 ABC transporter permease [Candidatus Bipolaricaulota bacterium]
MKIRLILLWGILKKNVIERKRYFFNSISGLLTIYLIFVLIFFGMKSFVSGPQFGNTADGLVVGFFLWNFIVQVYSELSNALIREARWGTLEQLYMSPVGFGWISFSQVLSSLAIFFLANVGFLYLIMLTTGRFLSLRIASTFPLLIITLLGVAGIGYFLGGLTLVFKRVESLLQIVQFLFVALVMVPVESLPLLKHFPVSFGASLIRRVMIDGTPITGLPPSDLGFLLLNSTVYFLLGYGAFKYFERVAKRKGLLGHY